MTRLAASVFAAAMLAGAATADVPPSPPPPVPKGKRWVRVNTEVLVGKDVTGYVFVEHGVPNPRSEQSDKYTKADLSDSKPRPFVPSGGRGLRLVAVPADAAKAYKTDEELFDAIKANKIQGMHALGCGGGGSILVEESATKGDAVTWTYTVTAIDPKSGIKWTIRGIGTESSPNAEEKPARKADKPLARAASWVTGAAGSLALVLAGVWLARRVRKG